MDIYQGIFGTIFLIGFSIMAFYVTKKGNYSGLRLKLLGYMGIIIGVLAINAVLLVIAPRVPYELKDGTFGGAGGILFGSCMFNVMLGGILLGLVWNKSKKMNADEAINQPPIPPEEKDRYPRWLNNFAHFTVLFIGGSAIGRLLFSLFKQRDFNDAFYFLGAQAALYSGVYLMVIIVYSIYKRISGTTIG